MSKPKLSKARTKAQRRRSGRPRRVDADRHADGQIIRAHKRHAEGPVIPTEALDRRADVVGPLHVTNQLAGTALGQMLLLGMIDQRQHDAGLRLAEVWQAWSCAACRPRFPIANGKLVVVDAGDPSDETVRRWCRLSEKMAAVRQAVLSLPAGALAWSMLEGAVMDDVIPPRLDPRSAFSGAWPFGLGVLRAALDAVHGTLVERHR